VSRERDGRGGGGLSAAAAAVATAETDSIRQKTSVSASRKDFSQHESAIFFG
jgi:hypothetical protein